MLLLINLMRLIEDMEITESKTTKDMIIESAKSEFYYHGYKDTTISKIFSSIDVPVGIFTYYFKTKDMLVYEIYKQFFDKLDNLIVSNYSSLKESYLLKQAVLSKIYYKIILEDKNNANFYYQVLEKRSNYHVIKDIISSIFHKYIDEFNVIIPDEEFNMIEMLDSGARREFFLNYFRNNSKIPVYQLSNTLEAIFPLMLRIDGKTVDSALLKSIGIADSLDYSHIKFLI